MAHTQVSNTFVGVPQVTGGIFRYKQNIVLPTTAYAPRPGGAIRLGGVSDEGVTYTAERAVQKRRDWNGDKVRSVQENKDDTYEVTFIEFLNPAVMAVAFGDDNVTVTPADAAHGTHISVRHNAKILDHAAYIIDSLDGTVKHRRVLPDAQVDRMDPIAEKPGDWTVFKLRFDLFPDAQGNTNYQYIELADKLVPTEWDVDIAGSAGTVVYTVDGESTPGVAYNASTTALDSALELLSTVGAGNATVAGSPGDYQISLARGGVLSAVGSGGATATVEAAE